MQLHQVGRARDAEALYRQVLGKKANHVAAQHFLGLLLHQTGRRKDGLVLIEQSVRNAKANPDFLNNLGTVQLDHGRLQEAVVSFKKAVAAKPDHAAARANLGSALRRSGEFEAAEKTFRRTIQLNPVDRPARVGLAETLQEAGRFEDALDVIRDAMTIWPRDASLNYRFGVVLMEKGDLAGAAERLRSALSVDPNMAEAWLALTQVKQQRESDDELAAMERQHAQKPAGSAGRMQLSFGLGKAYEDMKAYDRAFDFFTEGNTILRKTIDYDGARSRADFAAMKATFDASLFNDKMSDDVSEDTPIFVIGMPRSGTTLIEQILASHPQVFGAGELRYLRDSIAKCFPMDMQGGFPAGIRALPTTMFSAAGRTYLDMLQKNHSGHRHVTDKMPGNFLLVGFIRLMLPHAKIIHCVRDPVATCLSIYKTHFRNSGHLYGYDLVELADFYNHYADMMRHWHSVLPGVVHDVHYEHFVTDQESQTRKLVAYCGLPWDDACLAFHESARPVRTASVAQVRQPIYQGSIDLWRRYGDRIKPLLDRLNATGQAV